MFLRSSLLLLLVPFIASGIDIVDPSREKLPDPLEIERKNIERKYSAPAPVLSSPQKQEQKSDVPQQVVLPPPPPPVYKIKRETTADTMQKREISFGVDLKEKDKEKRQSHQQQHQSFQQTQQQPQQQQVKQLKGTCVVVNDVELVLEEAYSDVECLMSDKTIRVGEMVFIPQPQEYSLTAKFVHLSGKQVNTLRVLKGDRSSANIATYIDKKILSNIILKATRDSGKSVAEATSNIFKTASRTTMYGGGIGSTIVTTDPTAALSAIPKMALYTALANLVKSSSDEMLSNRERLPPLFRVAKGTELYVEIEEQQ